VITASARSGLPSPEPESATALAEFKVACDIQQLDYRPIAPRRDATGDLRFVNSKRITALAAMDEQEPSCFCCF
jgi:hypothetical protein